VKRPNLHGTVSSGRPRATSARGKPSLDPRTRLKRAERDESRRFTASSRRVTRVRLAVMGGFLALVAAVAAIVLSPLMALEKIEVVGLVSLDESVVVGAVADQRGRPLALLDFNDVRSKLGTVPQIESFATELRPPHTLVIRVVERVAVGSIRVATGYDVVDAAGVVIAFSEGEPAGIPAIFTADAAGPGFDAIVATLSALPTDVRADVKSISAESRDSVTFLLRSAAHEIRWGSDESASQKSAVLRQALVVAASRGGAFVIDVSAPDTLVMKPIG